MKLRCPLVSAALVALLLFIERPVFCQETAFTYQGLLNQGGVPANGTYQMSFALWNSATNGIEVAAPVSLPGIGVTNGLFIVTLDFGPAIQNTNANWLEITVATNGGGNPVTLNPRQELTPTPFAILAESASNVLGTVPVSQVSGMIPLAQLPPSVVTTNNAGIVSLTGTFAGNGGGLTNVAASNLAGVLTVAQLPWAVVTTNNAANVSLTGIFNGAFSGNGGGLTNLNVTQLANGVALGAGSLAAGQFATANNGGSFVWSDGTRAVSDPAANTFVASATGGFYFEVAGSNQVNISTNGTLSTPILTITGGSDVAEPFRISGEGIPDGSVVIIDAEHPGHLKLSDRPYDTRVAGVVSGANGIHPGIQMQQQGMLDGGRNVALTGRVYVQADTSNGAIRPGDLLTTSSIPGRAMKATDHRRAQGAILGKAMTGLSNGKGMVLVLVTLQ